MAGERPVGVDAVVIADRFSRGSEALAPYEVCGDGDDVSATGREPGRSGTPQSAGIAGQVPEMERNALVGGHAV